MGECVHVHRPVIVMIGDMNKKWVLTFRSFHYSLMLVTGSISQKILSLL